MKYSVLRNMVYLLRILWKEDSMTFLSMCVHILIGACAPFIAVLIPSVIIGLLTSQADMTSYILWSALLFALYGIVQGSLDFLKDYNDFAFIRTRTHYFVKKLFLWRSTLDYAMLEDVACKKILEDGHNAVQSNIEGAEGMYHHFINFMTAFLGLLLYAFSSSTLSIWLVVALLALVIVQYVCFSLAKKYEYSHRDQVDGYVLEANYLNQIAYDQAAGKDIRLFQLQDWIDTKFTRVNQLLTRVRTKNYSAYMLVDTLTLVLDAVRDIVCYGFLIQQLMQGMALDRFVFYLGIISGFSLWFKKVGEAYARLSLENVLVSRMREVFTLSNTMHHGDGEVLRKEGITIAFEHVSFSYPGQTRRILDDVSFILEEGKKMALVGVNGAGKSTIIKLMLGFYTPTAGRITINGIDIQDLDLDDYYHHITGIFQDSKVMSYTIAENVSLCDLSQTDREKVRQCLKQVGLWDVIAALPQQEVTYLYKDIDVSGVQLSGGQLQKLFMARVLYHSFDCLLLDEPTAALDALAEKELYESFHALTEGKSCLFISHRLSSTRFCDEILVLDQGHIIERGAHEQLLNQQGLYTKLFQAQSQYYEEEGEANESIAGN